jgi:hypothetical protein
MQRDLHMHFIHPILSSIHIRVTIEMHSIFANISVGHRNTLRRLLSVGVALFGKVLCIYTDSHTSSFACEGEEDLSHSQEQRNKHSEEEIDIVMRLID